MSHAEDFPKKNYALITIAIHLFVLGVLAVTIYFPVLNKPLNNFDDRAWLADTEVRNSIPTIFDPSLVSKNPFASTYYLPLQSALYLGMIKTFGRTPSAYHGLSIAIHAACTFLLYFLLLGFTERNRTLAFLGSFLFVVYLGHTQSVTWTAAAFSHPLVSVFVLATLLLFLGFLKTGRRTHYCGALFCFLIALLIRESAVVVPVLLVALELFYTNENGLSLDDRRREFLKRTYKYIPFFLGIIPIAMISIEKFQHGSLNERWGGVGGGIHPVLRFLDFSSLLVYPARLSMGWKIGLIAILLAIASWIIFNFRKRGNLFFALFWITLALAPYTISNFNPALAVMRYVYPAMLGFVLLLTVFVYDITRKVESKKRVYAIYFLFAAVGCTHLFFVLKAMY